MKKKLSQAGAILTLLLLFVASLPAAERRTLRRGVPDSVNAQRLDRLPASNHLYLAIGLPLRNKSTLANLLQQVYTPGSANFHRYLTPEQFAEQFGPTEQDYQNVIDYAKSSHLEVLGTYGNRALVDVAGSVADIEKMFQVNIGLYQHPSENRQFYAPDVAPSVPAGLPILYVSGLDNFDIPRPQVRRLNHAPSEYQPNVKNGSGTNSEYLGSDFRNAYVHGVSLKGSGQVIGLFEFGGYTASDITTYESLAGMASAPPLQNLVLPGAVDAPFLTDNDDNLEVALDIEMVIAMAPAATTVLVVIGTNQVDIVNAMASPGQGVPFANQISCSWGAGGNNDLDQVLLQLALQGQSFFLCSGDGGAPANGIQASDQDYNYLTTVGGTELSMTGTGQSWSNEVVWDYQYIQGASTGYIDTGNLIPPYQKQVNTSANGGSSVDRNVPDVAAVADWIEAVYTVSNTNKNGAQIITTGNVTACGGTSAATPLWAAYTALANEQAAAQGAPTVGFLNPALYAIAAGPSYSSCFHDITVGNNTNAGTANLFQAGPGYDNCTGLGSPTGINLINALVSFSINVFVDFNYTGATQNGSYDYPFPTLAKGISAVGSGGTIFIETAGSSSETMTITKPMTIKAIDGAATIGH